MRIINKDMTRESVKVFVTKHQIYAEIWSKSHGKWEKSEYFVSYDWEPDIELVRSTISYIKRNWDLKDPKVIVSK